MSGPVRDPALIPGEAGHPRPSEIFSGDDAPANSGPGVSLHDTQ